jgi:hypothetical protein
MLWTPLSIDIVVPLSLVNSLSRSARRDRQGRCAKQLGVCGVFDAPQRVNHGLLLKKPIPGRDQHVTQ